MTAQALLHQYLAKPAAVGIIWFQREIGFTNASGHHLGQQKAFFLWIDFMKSETSPCNGGHAFADTGNLVMSEDDSL